MPRAGAKPGSRRLRRDAVGFLVKGHNAARKRLAVLPVCRRCALFRTLVTAAQRVSLQGMPLAADNRKAQRRQPWAWCFVAGAACGLTPAQRTQPSFANGPVAMPTSINTNVASLQAQRSLTGTQSTLASSMQRLSSGLRVNSAQDDAAGLAIANRMKTQVRGASVAIRNANDGISLAQTAEGALATVVDALQRMRELAIQAQNATNGTSDRQNLNTEYQALSEEITRIAAQTRFNGAPILGASAGGHIIQIGPNNGDTMEVVTTNVTTVPGDLTTVAGAMSAVGAIDYWVDGYSGFRALYGSAISRLQLAIQNLSITEENQAAAEGRIMDADYAVETAQLSRSRILQDASQAMVAQANQLPKVVMTLLR
jgi:flagellin